MQGELQQLAFDDRQRLRLVRDDSGYVAAGEFTSTVSHFDKPAPRRVHWVEQWTASQHWDKFAGNPIYTPAMTGWNDWVNGVSIIPLPGGQTYRMYYAGNKGQGIGFAEASVSEPTKWKDHGGPILKPRADNWEGDFINQPRVVMVTATHWRMYYTGWGFKGAGSPWAMGLAESFDGGLTWKRYQDEPIIERGPAGSADDGAAMVPALLRVGDRWLMWYTGVKVTTNKAQHIHLCLAESADGIHWTKYENNPVLTDPSPPCSSPRPVKHGTTTSSNTPKSKSSTANTGSGFVATVSARSAMPPVSLRPASHFSCAPAPTRTGEKSLATPSSRPRSTSKLKLGSGRVIPGSAPRSTPSPSNR